MKVKRKEMANHEQTSAIEHLTKVKTKYDELKKDYSKLKNEHVPVKSQPLYSTRSAYSSTPRYVYDDY